MRKIEIEIPNDKEVDWEASAQQKQIVFKNKQVTYKDVCDELFAKGHHYINANGALRYVEGHGQCCSNNASTEHQLECILAKNKLANTARYLNGEWDDFLDNAHYIIWMNPTTRSLHVEHAALSSEHSNIMFKSMELGHQAIEILGEETVKLALTPLY